MTSTCTGDAPKIMLNFSWEGPNRWNHDILGSSLDARVVDLLFPETTNRFIVDLPENINPTVPERCSFICYKPLGTTKTSLLNVTIEKVRHLDLVVRISGRQETEHYKVELQMPETLHPGQTYTLLITSKDFAFSARLVKEEIRQESGIKNDIQDGIRKGDFDSSEELNELSEDELQARFAVSLQKDREFDIARLRTSNEAQKDEIIKMQIENLEMLLRLDKTLRNKGIQPKKPDTPEYRAVEIEAMELARQKIVTSCSIQ